MRVVVASDKWKGTLTAAEAGAAIAAGIRRERPDAEAVVVPVADGGEGTLDALLAAVGGERRVAAAAGPLGEPLRVPWGRLPDGRGILETAAAIGLGRLPAGRPDPLRATSRGAGDLVRAALDEGCEEIVLALGGSATVDGGAGMARALGFRLLDGAGRDLPEGGGALADLARIDPAGADPRLRGARFEAWCDVASVLLGPRGAARTYGPQKGADAAAVERLEAGLTRLAERLDRDLGIQTAGLPGAGAAGGLGAGAAAFLRAGLASGAGRILAAVGLERLLDGADLVITGEGRYDPEAMPGKLPDAVLARAAARGVAAAVLCGEAAVGDDPPPGVRVLSRADLAEDRSGPLGPRDLADLAATLLRRIAASPFSR